MSWCLRYTWRGVFPFFRDDFADLGDRHRVGKLLLHLVAENRETVGSPGLRRLRRAPAGRPGADVVSELPLLKLFVAQFSGSLPVGIFLGLSRGEYKTSGIPLY